MNAMLIAKTNYIDTPLAEAIVLYIKLFVNLNDKEPAWYEMAGLKWDLPPDRVVIRGVKFQYYYLIDYEGVIDGSVSVQLQTPTGLAEFISDSIQEADVTKAVQNTFNCTDDYKSVLSRILLGWLGTYREGK